MNPKDLIETNLLVKMRAGSHAYGTALPTSDEDYRGIFVANPESIRTPFFTVKEVADEKEEDTKFYELNNFMKLFVDSNPNIVELMWTDESDIIQAHDAYWYLRDFRKQFLSKRIIYTTTGYAMAQLKRIRGHNKWLTQQQAGINALKNAYQNAVVTEKWLRENFHEDYLVFLNEPLEIKTMVVLEAYQDRVLKDHNVQLIHNKRPRQTEHLSLVFNFTPDKIFNLNISEYHDNHRLISFSGDLYGLYRMPGFQTYNKDTHSLNLNYDGVVADTLGAPLMLVKFNKDEYKQSLEKYNQFNTWRENRNAARHELEAAYGYDTKHAMHLVRLLRMGYEAVTQGEIIVKRPDAQELLDIRFGKRTYEEIVTYAEEMEKKVFEEGKVSTIIPHSPDLKLAAKVTMDVQDMVWKSLSKN